jgi:hypothetical protein
MFEMPKEEFESLRSQIVTFRAWCPNLPYKIKDSIKLFSYESYPISSDCISIGLAENTIAPRDARFGNLVS